MFGRPPACADGPVDGVGDGLGELLGVGDGLLVPVSAQLYDVLPLLVCVQVYVCVVPPESFHDHVHDDGGGP